jgi:hypothetical protein
MTDTSRISLLPTCGTKFYEYGSSWSQVYSEDLTDRENLGTTIPPKKQALCLSRSDEPLGLTRNAILTPTNDAVQVGDELRGRAFGGRA